MASRATSKFPKDHSKWVKHAESQLDFHQEGPHFGNQFTEDEALQKYLEFFLKYDTPSVPEPKIEAIITELKKLGEKSIHYQKISQKGHKVRPVLQKLDPSGNKLNKVITSDSYQQINRALVADGIIGDTFQEKHGEGSRLVQLAKLYLLHSSIGISGCLLSLTDGVASVVKNFLKAHPEHPLRQELSETLDRLTSSDPCKAWSSGQWMTEKRGGSDITQGSKTLAVQVTEHRYRLYGKKWFASCVDADVTLVLAKIVDPKTEAVDAKLSAFLVKLRDEEGRMKREVDILGLKEMMGIKQLPIADVLLKGVEGVLVSKRGEGVKGAGILFTIARLATAMASVSGARRVVALNKDYAYR